MTSSDDDGDAPAGQSGQGVVRGVFDNSDAHHRTHEKQIRAMLKRVTGDGDDGVEYVAYEPGNRETTFILSLNSLQYEKKLRDAVKSELLYPYSITRSETLGRIEDPNRLDGGWKRGFPTLVIVRRSIYAPAIGSGVRMIAKIAVATGLFFGSLNVLWWLFHVQ